MSNERSRVDRQRLKSLAPLDALSDVNFEELWQKTYLESLPAGGLLFRQGDKLSVRYYLIAGRILLEDPSGAVKEIDGHDPVCRYPLANQLPRRLTAMAKTSIAYIRIDNDMLDMLLTWDESASYVVADIEEHETKDIDWMTRILRSSIFQRVPPANIQAMFMRMQEMTVMKDQAVIRQGDVPDYFYVIKRGRCEVVQQTPGSAATTLASLGPGDGFGEEALLADTQRNASVIVVDDGVVMKLTREDFNALLKEPVIERVNMTKALQLNKEGALFLDVRLQSEAQLDSLEGSMHIPFGQLRQKAQSLDHARPYILYCDTGRRSSAAAYLLSARGIETYVIEGGLSKYAQRAA